MSVFSRKNISYADLIRHVQGMEGQEGHLSSYASVRVAILRNITLEPMIPALKYLCYDRSINPDIYLGAFDNAMQEVLDKSSPLHEHNPDMIVVAMDGEPLIGGVGTQFLSRSMEEVDEALDGAIGYINQLLINLESQFNCPVLVSSFRVPPYSPLGIMDHQNDAGKISKLTNLNNQIKDLIVSRPNAYLLDLDTIIRRLGDDNFFDSRGWQMYRMPFSRDAMLEIAAEISKFVFALKGKAKKCLVIDCDNTLWGGIVGEDGADGIKLDGEYPGSAFIEVQKFLIELSSRGIILAICSKNNLEDVIAVFNEREEFLLKEEHFSTITANWDDKPSNIIAISKLLNIGLDQMVFVDDQLFEISAVNDQLPEVETILVPENPADLPNLIMREGWFDTLTYSTEDQQRNSMYRADARRREVKQQSVDLEGFLASLNIVAEISSLCDADIARVAQLSQRTNQFTLTTTRYLEGELRSILDDPMHTCLTLKVSDKFGDYGLVGAGVIKRETDQATLESMFLSCRVIGRGVETVLLSHLVNACRKKAKTIHATYKQSTKNVIISEFLEDHGFGVTEKNDNTKKYELDASGEEILIPSYVEVELNEQ